MKKTFLYFILFLSAHIYSQEKNVLDIFKIEFLRDASLTKGSVNDYYTDILDKTLFFPENNFKYGFYYSNGKAFTKAEFDYASDFFGDKANIVENKIPGVIFKNGKKRLFPDYDATYWYYEDIGIGKKGSDYFLIDLKGHKLSKEVYNDIFPFHDGFASIRKGEKWNYVDKKGKKIFNDSLLFSYRPIIANNAVFMVEEKKVEQNKMTGIGSRIFIEFLNKVDSKELKEGLIDINGKVLLEPIYDEISGYYIDGYMIVKNNGKFGAIDKKNNVVIPLIYEELSDFDNGMFIAKKEKKVGVIDIKNTEIIPFQYDKIKYFQNELALIEKSKKMGYINKKGELVIEPTLPFNLSGDFYSGKALVKSTNNTYYFINTKNEIIIDGNFEDALPFINSQYTIVSNKGISYFIDENGIKIFEIAKPYLWNIRNGFIRYAE